MPAIVKWSPFRELDWMDRGMRRIFHDFALTPGLLPAADVYETKDEFVVELEVPGFEQRELAIEVTDHTLVVKCERTEANEDEKDRQFRLREHLEQAFERRFYLPSDSDTERVKAKFSKGVLEVHTQSSQSRSHTRSRSRPSGRMCAGRLGAVPPPDGAERMTIRHGRDFERPDSDR